jgi:predicted nuclease with TOPRIM domain
MWTDEKQRQLDALREKEFAGILTADEQQQLELLFAEIDAEEAEMLRPAMERMDAEIEAGEKELARLQVENAARETLLAKRAALVKRAQELLTQLQAENHAIQAEYERAVRQPASV